jgi:hypothetical protein
LNTDESTPQSPEDASKSWSTPIDVRLAIAFVAIVVAFLFFNGIVESFLHSAEFFDTGNRRLWASAVSVVVFVLFWLYVRYRKPYWRGWHGHKEKLESPKLRHGLYLAGIFAFVWVPTVPGLMPMSPLEQSIRLEIPKEVGLLQEKIAAADRDYKSMVEEEDRAAEFATYPRVVQLSMRPPMPYAGLSERLQADFPVSGISAAEREHELEAAGERFKVYADMYRSFAETEGFERVVLSFFRGSWQHYADMAAWTTRIVAYRKMYRFLVIGVYVRTLRDLQPKLKSVGLPSIEIPRDLEVTKEPVSTADQKRLDLGVPPEVSKADLTPSELHVGHPMLR